MLRHNTMSKHFVSLKLYCYLRVTHDGEARYENSDKIRRFHRWHKKKSFKRFKNRLEMPPNWALMGSLTSLTPDFNHNHRFFGAWTRREHTIACYVLCGVSRWWCRWVAELLCVDSWEFFFNFNFLFNLFMHDKDGINFPLNFYFYY